MTIVKSSIIIIAKIIKDRLVAGFETTIKVLTTARLTKNFMFYFFVKILFFPHFPANLGVKFI